MHERALRVIDVSDPGSPHEVQRIPVPTWAYDVDVANDLAYVAAREGGVLIYRHRAEETPTNNRLWLPLALRPSR